VIYGLSKSGKSDDLEWPSRSFNRILQAVSNTCWIMVTEGCSTADVVLSSIVPSVIDNSTPDFGLCLRSIPSPAAQQIYRQLMSCLLPLYLQALNLLASLLPGRSTCLLPRYLQAFKKPAYFLVICRSSTCGDALPVLQKVWLNISYSALCSASAIYSFRECCSRHRVHPVHSIFFSLM